MFGVQSICQQAPNGDVFIQVLPVDSYSTANEPPMSALRGRSAKQARKPFERRRNAASVGESDDNFVVRERNVNGACNGLTG